MKNSQRTRTYFSDRTLEIANRRATSNVAGKKKQKKLSATKKENETKMSFYSIERRWSMSYTVFPIIISIYHCTMALSSFAFCSRTTEHCSLSFETRNITFYQVEYNFACFSSACMRRLRARDAYDDEFVVFSSPFRRRCRQPVSLGCLWAPESGVVNCNHKSK